MWNMSLAQADTGVGVLDRTMTILEAVERGARSFTEIVAATGFTRSTTHRLVKAMEEHGLLTASGGRGYRLGPRLLSLSATAIRDLPLRDLAHTTLERLARDTAESAQLYVRDGARRVCIDAVESTEELRTIVPVGASLPLTKGSAGKVLLAWTGAHDRERLLGALAPGDAPQLERQVAAARRRGWAASVGEREAGVASVSAPVFDGKGTLMAAVSVSGPANRIGTGGGKRYAPAVTAAAAEIGHALAATSA
jgi:DNA-binding IclR family transcriptional regulator